MEIKIRTAASADIPQILELYSELHPHDEAIDLNTATATFEQATCNDIVYFVADDGGRVVGTCYIAIIPNITKQCSAIGFIENVVTAADCRRCGIGRKLMNAAVEYAKTHGCYKAMLSSGNSRTDAHKFYESIGFDGNSKRAFQIRF